MEFICLDIETTGLDPDKDSIIEFAAARFNEHEIIETYQTFIYFPYEIPKLIQHLTGIDQSMTENAPTLESVKAKIMEFCGDLPIIGHNIGFDSDFLIKNGIELPGALIDTLPLSQILIENTLSYSLETLCAKLNKENFPSHRALDDVLGNIELFYTFMNMINKLSDEQTYLWSKILQNCDCEYSKILLNFLPKTKQEPTFAPIKRQVLTNQLFTETLHIEEILNANLTETIKSKDQNTLFILNYFTIKRISEQHFTRLPDYNSLISADLFKEQINKEKITEPERDFLLKIATKITEKFPLNRADLNLAHADYDILPTVLIPEYIIPESEKPYLSSHFTFFKLLAENQLPASDEVHFETIPFIEETFIRSQEKRITLRESENGKNLTMLFAKLGIFAEKIRTQTENHYGDYVILDNFEVLSDEFQSFLQELDTNLSKELKSDPNKYLVWIYLFEGQAPSVSFIEKNIKFDLKQLLQNMHGKKVFIHRTTKVDNPFFIEVDNQFPDANSMAFARAMVDKAWNTFSEIKGQGLILSPNKALLTQIHKSLAQTFDEKGITLLAQDITGSRGKLLENIENNESPVILACTHQFFLKNRPNLKNIEQAMITKMPMMLPNHPYYEYLKTNTTDSFSKLTIPNTANILYQICAELQNLNTNISSVTLLDNRLAKTNWGIEIQNNLPKNILVRNA